MTVQSPSTCPECGDSLRATMRRCKCGWIVPRAMEAGQDVPVRAYDPEYGWCAWRSGGERCRYPGVASSGTHGAGPWYCVGHHRLADPLSGGHIVDESIEASGPRPDYTFAARRESLAAAHNERMRALGYGLKPVGPKTLRDELDRAAASMTVPTTT